MSNAGSYQSRRSNGGKIERRPSAAHDGSRCWHASHQALEAGNMVASLDIDPIHHLPPIVPSESPSMKRWILALGCLLLVFSSQLVAEETPPPSPVKLEPGAVIELVFPDLPETLASMSSDSKEPARLTAILPEDYTPEKKFPLFIYLLGGGGGRGNQGDLGMGRGVIGNKGYICAVMPLFKKKLDITEPARGLMVSMDDFEVISKSYRTMLTKLDEVVPNITSKGSVLGGHSNGAHTTGVLIAGQDDFIFERFDSFYLHEGGLTLLFANVLQKQSMKKPRFLVMIGGKGPFLPFGALLERMVARGGFQFTFVAMEGYGHEQPPEYLAQIGQWARGEPLTLPPKEPAEAKTDEAKPEEAKPDEPKPDTAQPADAKPADGAK